MSTVSLTGPVPLSRVWSGPKVLAEDLTGEDLADVLDLHADAVAWWVLDRSTPYGQSELRRLAEALDLDDLVLADVSADDQRAKFEQIGQSRLVVINAVTPPGQNGEFLVQPLSVLVTSRAVICLTDQSGAVEVARRLASHAHVLAAGGVEAALQLMVGAVVESYGAVVTALEEASDALATALFAEHPLSKADQLHAFRLRQQVGRLRRLTDPMRGITADLALNCDVSDQSVQRHWSSIVEQQQRIADAADEVRDQLASVFDTSLALAELQLNGIIKKLTGWAAVLAVPTLLGTVVGMNVAFPLAGTAAGFWLYLLMMVAVAAVLFVVLRHKNWI